ncbi:MAG: 16S rRNA (guanine(527)-N(7))-methyltransferase RsmG [Candidatus Cloacimonetes bacterium]|jgi:16S rRNA (guanine527-N7)-methyltransferase|nr:16S rRNA (guanine(527)-N(7))-methyltransferase RsmG [Candidatus Cloacimonadota bacterium]MBT6994865.1 16S rRNA (guanine(527)-N(7))-methyltransferase RsmG [Candidatus Cloacimonadota bacterium]MBT7468800.1 16S rRNA (guanine(527)-N(7))-methyltransferase RsmG [Candidatus Cloacimonadota bacterium]
MKKEIFRNYLKKISKEKKMELFQKYHQFLLEENAMINLVSRKTNPEDFWTIHFLDSILLTEHFDFSNKKILDFGTGGGLPGIPLKILYPNAEVYLLDSRQKKMQSVEKIIKKLDLKRCFTIVSRLEDMDEEWLKSFDVIVCRSVKILPKFKKWMLKLLKDDGEIILYKSKKMDDVEQFTKVEIFNVSHPEIGERKIVRIRK